MRTVYLRGRKGLVITVLVFILMGAIFSIVGVVSLSNNLDLSRNGISAQGTVIDLERHYGTKRKITYKPEIEYTTSDGETVRVVYSIGSNPPAYSVGEKVKIIYSKDNHEDIVIDSILQIYGLPVIAALVGVVIFFAGIAIGIRRLPYM